MRASTDASKGKGNEYDCVGPPGGFYFIAVDGMLVLLLLLLLQQQRQQQRQWQHGLNAGSHRVVVRTDEGKGKGKEDDFCRSSNHLLRPIRRCPCAATTVAGCCSSNKGSGSTGITLEATEQWCER